MNRRALVRRPSPRLAEGLLTHSSATRSMSTWRSGSGTATWPHCTPRAGRPSRSRHPRSARTRSSSRTRSWMYGDLAVITRPGADERKTEHGQGPSSRCAELGYRIAHIEAPWDADGGDVLKHDGMVWVGLAGRTNQAGADRLAGHLEPLGARVTGSADQGAAPEVSGHRPARRNRRGFRGARRRSDRLVTLSRRPRGTRRARRPARREHGADVRQRSADPTTRTCGKIAVCASSPWT